MGVPISSAGNVRRGDPPHQGVHQKATENHIKKRGLTTHIQYVYGGGADPGDDPVGAMVGPVRVT